MPVTKVNASGWKFHFNTGTEAAPVWTQIKGITGFSPGSDPTQADTTDFDSAGIGEHQVVRRTHTLTLSGMRLEDTANGTRDAGQDAVESLARNIGPASVGQLRLTSPGNKTYTFKCTASVAWPGTTGGGNDDMSAWEATMNVTGAVTVA